MIQRNSLCGDNNVYIYIYIYREREREREKEVYRVTWFGHGGPTREVCLGYECPGVDNSFA